jgi:hypothetical protein
MITYVRVTQLIPPVNHPTPGMFGLYKRTIYCCLSRCGRAALYRRLTPAPRLSSGMISRRAINVFVRRTATLIPETRGETEMCCV